MFENEIAPQSPGSGSVSLEVNKIGSLSVPIAINVPLIYKLTKLTPALESTAFSNFIVTPGSIVRVAFSSILMPYLLLS